MSKRSACLLVLVVLVSLISVGSQGQPTRSQKAHNPVRVMKDPNPPGNNPPPSPIGLLSSTSILAGASTYSTYPGVVGDFNGDGNKDFASVITTFGTGSAYQIAVALGNGDGTFQSTVQTTTGELADPATPPIWVGDLNGDGKDDLVMGHNAASPATYQVFLSNGDGTFTAKTPVAIGTSSAITWGTLFPDPDSNHFLDLIIVDGLGNGTKGNLWIAKGNGDGTFQAPAPTSFPGKIAGNSAVAFADFDGDGIVDFAGPDATTNQETVYFSKSGYQTPVALVTPDSAYNTCYDIAGDLNGDGFPEIISSNANCNTSILPNSITVYVNHSGTFAQGVYYSVGVSPVAASVADVNGDGHNDVVVTDCNSGDVRVLLGNNDGTLQTASAGYATGGDPHTPALVAVFKTGSGKADIVIPDRRFAFAYLPGYGDGTFRSAMNYYAVPHTNGYFPNGVGIASGDFNGDGIPDFVIGNISIGAYTGITVFLSNADGSMQPGVSYDPNGTNFMLEYVAVGDFDGDGKLDIAATDNNNGLVQIFTGVGDGTFAIGATYSTGVSANPLGIVASDFNGDGKPDLAVINTYGSASADVGVLINNGTGGFNPVVNYPLAASQLATDITAADLNGDNKLDLVVPVSNGSTVALFLGKGDGTFQAGTPVTVGSSPYYASVGDLNGDGKADLAVTVDQANAANQGIAIALGNGDGTFQAPTLVLLPQQGSPLAVTFPRAKMIDLDRNGQMDLVYTNAYTSTVNLLYGKGDGTFYDPVPYGASRFAWNFALADVNADGVSDVVVTGSGPLNGFGFSGVTVLLNTSGALTSLKSSGSPSISGTSVTFTSDLTTKVRGLTAAPTGTVSFYDGTTKLGSGTIASEQAIFATSSLAVGTHSITAHYDGDANFVPSISAAVNQVVPLPTYTVSASPTTQTVKAGTSASYTITLTPSEGYNGTVTISCPATLPTGVTCNTPTIGPGQTQATLTMTTQAPHAAMLAPVNLNPHPGASNLWASLGGLGIVGMILAGDWKRRNRRGLMILLGILAFTMILALVGCGGGSSSGSGGGGGGGLTGGTPAGTYPNIQATAAGTAGTNGGDTAIHQLPKLTLVVQ